jgi:hypothetical protein
MQINSYLNKFLSYLSLVSPKDFEYRYNQNKYEKEA